MVNLETLSDDKDALEENKQPNIDFQYEVEESFI
jgi:hypothetical protein